jgi:hypothetical protein
MPEEDCGCAMIAYVHNAMRDFSALLQQDVLIIIIACLFLFTYLFLAGTHAHTKKNTDAVLRYNPRLHYF